MVNETKVSQVEKEINEMCTHERQKIRNYLKLFEREDTERKLAHTIK